MSVSPLFREYHGTRRYLGPIGIGNDHLSKSSSKYDDGLIG